MFSVAHTTSPYSTLTTRTSLFPLNRPSDWFKSLKATVILIAHTNFFWLYRHFVQACFKLLLLNAWRPFSAGEKEESTHAVFHRKPHWGRRSYVTSPLGRTRLLRHTTNSQSHTYSHRNLTLPSWYKTSSTEDRVEKEKRSAWKYDGRKVWCRVNSVNICTPQKHPPLFFFLPYCIWWWKDGEKGNALWD